MIPPMRLTSVIRILAGLTPGLATWRCAAQALANEVVLQDGELLAAFDPGFVNRAGKRAVVVMERYDAGTKHLVTRFLNP